MSNDESARPDPADEPGATADAQAPVEPAPEEPAPADAVAAEGAATLSDDVEQSSAPVAAVGSEAPATAEPRAETSPTEVAAEPRAVTAAPPAPAVAAAPPAPAVTAAPQPPAVAAAAPTPAVAAAPDAPSPEAGAETSVTEPVAETPAAESPAETPGTERPVTGPVADAPGAETPRTETAAEAPVAEPPAETPGTDAAAEAPGAQPSAEAPSTAAAAASGAPTPSSTPAPGPVPKPGPRPSPAVLAGSVRPPAPTAPSAPPPAPVPAETAEAPSDSARFGRVDDDGTVHVRLPDGSEAAVGQWAAGTPAEGLAFFVRKYDDLSVEVDLATRRLSEGKSSPEQAAAVVKRVREALASPSMVGDLASLGGRVERLESLVAERRRVVSEERAAAKAAALAVREAIVAEAEQLAESTQWKATGDRFKALLDEWKAAPRADRSGEQALWKRFSHARSQFDKHRRQYFARLDGERGEAKQVKEALVAEAEALRDSTDWGATAGAYRDLMTRWKAAGRAGKADEEALWARFRAAQDAFFSARSAAFGQRDAGFAENLAAKEALLAEAEAIDTSDLKAAKSALRGIQERWEQIGHVPRGDKERIEGRLRRVEETVRKGEQDQWKRTNPEAKARAEATVEQFQGSLDKLEKEKAAAEAAGDARRAADAESRIATTRSLLEAAQRAATEFGA